MDIDYLFDTSRDTQTWRNKVSGEALELCEAIEKRIEATGQAPSWVRVSDALAKHGVTTSAGSVGMYYRKRFPQLRRQ
jgi:hypothetical protein